MAQNFPKVCFGCSRPHINQTEDEVEVDGGVKVYHKDCYKIEQIVEKVVEMGPQLVQKVEEKVESKDTLVNKIYNRLVQMFGEPKNTEEATELVSAAVDLVHSENTDKEVA